jgi:16S rRNA (cytidine1402-2'-O)-methyltransferase
LGFPPTRSKERKKWFLRAGGVVGTLVFFEAPHRIRATLRELHRTVGNCQVVIGRELTKLHEELVRGQIVEVLDRLIEERGEFTVVAFIGHTTHNKPAAVSSPCELATEFGHMTMNRTTTKRQAINVLARRHGLSPNEIYAALEAAKKSGR